MAVVEGNPTKTNLKIPVLTVFLGGLNWIFFT